MPALRRMDDVAFVGWDQVASTAGPPAFLRNDADRVLRIEKTDFLANQAGGPAPKRLVPLYGASHATRTLAKCGYDFIGGSVGVTSGSRRRRNGYRNCSVNHGGICSPLDRP